MERLNLRRKAVAAGLAVTAGITLFFPSLTATGAGPAAKPEKTADYELPKYPETEIGPKHNRKLPNIVVIDAGGTITSTARDRISYQHYQGSVQGGVQTILEDMYPELASVANITLVKSSDSIGGSASVNTQKLYNLSRAIDKQLSKGDVDGLVITAGTNVLEEDGYFFDLTVRSDKPVVLTGSMHQYGTFTYDGYTNLFSSIRVAASGETTCFGTVVLLNDQFFAARDVTKTDGLRMDTFEGGPYGALGVVNEDNIQTMRAPARVLDCGTGKWKTPFNLAKTTPDQFAKVDIVEAGYLEASAATIQGLVDAGVDGIVTAGHGPGGLSSLQSPARTAAMETGVVFATTSRTGGEGTYDTGTGPIGAADLLPWKARILLQLGLTYSDDPGQVRRWFNDIGNAQFDMSERR